LPGSIRQTRHGNSPPACAHLAGAVTLSYQNWLKQNLNKIKGPTAEVGVAECELSFVDAACELAKYSETVTKDVSLYQEGARTGNGAIRKIK
jgi:hypothetical protein